MIEVIDARAARRALAASRLACLACGRDAAAVGPYPRRRIVTADGAIGVRLALPAATVRSCLRRARANADQLYRFGVQTVVALDPICCPPRPPGGTTRSPPVAAATIQRFTLDHRLHLWQVISVLTRGRLLAPASSP
jgi:hypothetical protein